MNSTVDDNYLLQVVVSHLRTSLSSILVGTTTAIEALATAESFTMSFAIGLAALLLQRIVNDEEITAVESWECLGLASSYSRASAI